MSFKKVKLMILFVFFFSMVNTASATRFWRSGDVLRVLNEGTLYGNCMVFLSKSVANGCPDSGWVSLDCTDTYYPAGTGKIKLATVLTALSLGKKIAIYIDNTKKHNGYCVAQRIDLVN